MSAPQGSASVTIQAPLEQVWPWVADLTKHAAWSPKPYRVELVSGTIGEVGSRYRSIGWVPGDKEHANSVEITELVAPTRLALRADDPMGAFHSTYDLRPAGGGTEATFHLAFPEIGGVSGFFLPVLFPLVALRDMRKRMGLLKAAVEAKG